MKDHGWHHGHGPGPQHWFGHGFGRGFHGERGRHGGRGGDGPGGRGRGGFWRGPFGGHHGGPGGRLERGLLRLIILDVLQDGPKHGYEIIKQVEERTGGHYSPSPGTLYPTLQYLEDLGSVRADQLEERRVVYHLTDAGRAELDKSAPLLEHFWARFRAAQASEAGRAELNFLEDAIHDLNRTIRSGLRDAAFAGDTQTVREVRLVLERVQNEVREIITRRAEDRPSPDEGSDDVEAAEGGSETTRF